MIENILFIKHISGKILAIENELRKRVKSIVLDEYIGICEGHSAPSLGALIRLILDEKLENLVFGGKGFEFRKYCSNNKDRIKINNGSIAEIYIHIQVQIALSIYRMIRNRAFHGANMFKMYEKNGKVSPRIFTQVYLGKELLNFGVEPCNIEIFLDDLGGVLGVCEWDRF